MIRYRPDIDGLRALAVVPVILFHAHVPGFSGGYVGVDVFFVISGYLITSLIAAELDSGRFSLLRFYERRVRRIFPALFTVMAATGIAGALILLPGDFKNLSASIAAAAFFVSNILFWRQSGYFDAAAEEKPLLHTWSLAVEEQYYIVFPLMLMALAAWLPGWRLRATMALAAASFALAEAMVHVAPTAAFFLAPTRFWELLAGSLLALGAFPAARDGQVRDIAGLAGAALILAAVFAYGAGTPFPGATALAPVIGTVLVIWAGGSGGGAIFRVLASAPAVYVGKISYSLYLWHFPLFAFANYLTIGSVPPAITVGLIALTFLLAHLTWRFIETPARARSGDAPRLSPRAVVLAGAFAIGAVAAPALAVYATQGLPGRFEGALAAIAAAPSDIHARRGACFHTPPARVRAGDLCQMGADETPPRVLVWGNSHADSFAPGLAEAAARQSASFLFATYNGCPIAAEMTLRPRFKYGPQCEEFNAAVLDHVLARDDIMTVVLAFRWPDIHADLSRAHRPFSLFADAHGRSRSLADNEAIFARSLERLVKRLTDAGHTVWIIGPVPLLKHDVPRALYLRALGLFERRIRTTRENFTALLGPALDTIAHLEAAYGVKVVWPHEAMCTEDRCRVAAEDGTPLYVDDNHLSASGALWLAGEFEPIFAGP